MKCKGSFKKDMIFFPFEKSEKLWLNSLKSLLLKPLYTFGTEKKKVHRFTNNEQGLQKVMVKDFYWNIIPQNALLLEKTLKQYQFSIARITDLVGVS